MASRFFLIFIVAFLTPISFVAQQSNKNNFFELSGFVTGRMVEKYIYISYSTDNNIKVIDSAKMINNHFIFKGSIRCPTKATICNNVEFNMTDKSSAQIFLEPRKMSINFDFYNFKDLILKGSNTHNNYVDLTKVKKEASDKRDSISKLYGIYYDEIKTLNDSAIINDLQNKVNDLDEFMEQINTKEIEIETNFIKQNPSSFVSLDILLPRLRRREVTYETISLLYNSLTKNVKDSEAGKQLYLILENVKNSGLGSLAPNFTVKDMNDKQIVLTSFRNEKYVLLDFWASWCMPCRQDFPFLNEIFNMHNEKGFEIISISRDENPALWRKAIEKDNVEKWKHFSIKENNSPIENIYVVTAIPVKILINKDGVIIGRWRGGGEENKAEIKKILNGIFDK